MARTMNVWGAEVRIDGEMVPYYFVPNLHDLFQVNLSEFIRTAFDRPVDRTYLHVNGKAVSYLSCVSEGRALLARHRIAKRLVPSEYFTHQDLRLAVPLAVMSNTYGDVACPVILVPE